MSLKLPFPNPKNPHETAANARAAAARNLERLGEKPSDKMVSAFAGAVMPACLNLPSAERWEICRQGLEKMDSEENFVSALGAMMMGKNWPHAKRIHEIPADAEKFFVWLGQKIDGLSDDWFHEDGRFLYNSSTRIVGYDADACVLVVVAPHKEMPDNDCVSAYQIPLEREPVSELEFQIAVRDLLGVMFDLERVPHTTTSVISTAHRAIHHCIKQMQGAQPGPQKLARL